MNRFRGLYVLNGVLVLLLLSLALTAVLMTVRSEPDEISIDIDSHCTKPSAPKISDAEQKIVEYATSHGTQLCDYPQSLIDLLARNPETEQFVLEYPTASREHWDGDLSEYDCSTVPLLMQWDRRWGYIQYGDDFAGLTACGPVCLSMVAYYITGDASLTPVYMMDFAVSNGYCVPGDGTSWTFISEGGEILGMDVTEIPLDETQILKNLEVGNPIICAMGPGDFTSTGHYVVMVGYSDGLIQINDPNSHTNSLKLWRYDELSGQIENLWVIR